MNFSTQTLQTSLKSIFGFNSFKGRQEKIILNLLDGNDSMVIMPTGGGKSICFQIPTLLKEGVCIVISPLIALMQDQVKNLKKRNIKALTIPSGSNQNEIIVTTIKAEGQKCPVCWKINLDGCKRHPQ